MTPKVEITPLVGQRYSTEKGKLENFQVVGIERLFLNGRQIATINKIPGAPIALLPGSVLSSGELEEVARVVASARGGVRPAKIGGPHPDMFQLLDDEIEEPEADEVEGDETEVEESDE